MSRSFTRIQALDPPRCAARASRRMSQPSRADYAALTAFAV